MTKRTRNEDDDLDFITKVHPLGFSVKQSTSHLFLVHINTEIRNAEHYSQIFDLLLEAGEEDTVHFLIESPGGDLAGLNTLLEGIKMTEAHVVGVIVGAAHSAASILALNCHEVVVCSGAEMLCHAARTGFGGKLADLEAYTSHSKKVTHKLMKESYKGFLTDLELEKVLDGKEMWLDAEEIQDRLEQRAKYFTEGLTKEDNAEAERTPDVQPQERRSKSKKVQ